MVKHFNENIFANTGASKQNVSGYIWKMFATQRVWGENEDFNKTLAFNELYTPFLHNKKAGLVVFL